LEEEEGNGFFSATLGADLSLKRCSNTVVVWGLAYLSRAACVVVGLAVSGSLDADRSLL